MTTPSAVGLFTPPRPLLLQRMLEETTPQSVACSAPELSTIPRVEKAEAWMSAPFAP